MLQLLRYNIRRHKIIFLVDVILIAILLTCLACLAWLEGTFNSFKESGFIEEGLQSNRVEYAGEYTPDLSKSLIDMYDKMSDSDKFEIYEKYHQHIEWINYNLPDEFVYGYEYGTQLVDATTNMEYKGNQYKITSVKSTQIDTNYIERFSLKVSKGRMFEKSDFNLSFGDTVPVILGYEYSDHLSVGDQFEAIYLYGLFTFKIIGFFSEDSFITDNIGNVYFLDRDVVIPMFNIMDTPPSREDAFFQTLHYANKTSCTLVYDTEIGESAISDELNSISNSCNLPNYDIYITAYREDSIPGPIKEMSFAINIGKWAIFFIAVGILAITLSKQITRSLTDLSVFILFVSLHQIICSLISELICLVFFAMSIALLLSFLIFPCLESILLVCFSGILLCFMLIGFILVRSKHLNLKIYLVESDTSDRTKRDN